MADAPTLLKTQEVADMFRVDRKTVNRWVREGRLTPVVGIPSTHLRFRKDDVDRLLAPRGAA